MSAKLNTSFTHIVSDLHTKTRLDAYLAKQYPQYSRAKWSQQITNGQLKVNNIIARQSTNIKNADIITGNYPADKSTNQLTAPKIIPQVLYKDNDVIVINKPAGLLTHALTGKKENSVSGAFKSEIKDDDPLRAGIVHRLDKQTSGVMILARNEKAKVFLTDQFKTRNVKKVYTALVHGNLQNDTARLELPIKRSHNNPQKMIISKQGKPAISEYHTIKKYKDYTLLSIKIMTGRTHQIRVQLAYLGHPVVGDIMYGNKKQNLPINRHFLHASELTIELPSALKKTFEAPLPQDLQNALKKIS